MYDFNDVKHLLSVPAHFTNDLRCLLFICYFWEGSYRLLLGAIIMMGCEVEGVSMKGIQGEKK